MYTKHLTLANNAQIPHSKRLKIMEQAVASQCIVVKSDQTGVDKLV